MAPLVDFLSQFWSIVWTTSVWFLFSGCEVLQTSPWLYVHAVDLPLAAVVIPLTVCWSHRPSLCCCECRGLPLASSFVCCCVYWSYGGLHCHSSCFCCMCWGCSRLLCPSSCSHCVYWGCDCLLGSLWLLLLVCWCFLLAAPVVGAFLALKGFAAVVIYSSVLDSLFWVFASALYVVLLDKTVYLISW